MAARADAVTYDFSGTVTSSDFSSVKMGTAITGTYTINLANANPADSDNSIGTTPWTRANLGGSAYGGPVPSGTVFSSSLSAGSFAYTGSAPSPSGSFSQVTGGEGFYSAFDIEHTAISPFFTQSSFEIANTLPFTSNGLPLFGAGATGNGAFFFGTYVTTGPGLPHDSGMQLDYSITSFRQARPAAAPEIDPASALGGLTLLLGCLAVLRGRRQPEPRYQDA
jgi:hypothetical protein